MCCVQDCTGGKGVTMGWNVYGADCECEEEDLGVGSTSTFAAISFKTASLQLNIRYCSGLCWTPPLHFCWQVMGNLNTQQGRRYVMQCWCVRSRQWCLQLILYYNQDHSSPGLLCYPGHWVANQAGRKVKHNSGVSEYYNSVANNYHHSPFLNSLLITTYICI